jgi:glycosyltransferase involved in cell wall biosynthesis
VTAANVPFSPVAARRGGRHATGLSFESVVHVNEKGGSFGGTEEYIALVTAALSPLGVRSSLVCGAVTGSLPPDLDEVRVVAGLAARRPRPDTAREVAAVIADLDPDVIYVHNVFDPAIVPALAGLADRGVLLWYVHDHYLTCLSELRWRRDLGSCPHRLGHDCLTAIADGHCVLRHPDRVHRGEDVERRMALSGSLGAADAVIVVSDYMRTLLEEAEPQLDEDLHVLSRPIRDFGSLRPRRRRGARDPAIVAYAGRITAEKGLAVVIEALGATPPDIPVELRIAGVIEDDQYWRQCQRLLTTAQAANRGLTAAYLGHLDYQATDDLFRQSDIVTIPSRWPEPLGAVALEAMAAGAAVIASPVGGLARIIVDRHNGLHAAAGDVDSWTVALSELLARPDDAARLGRRAHHDVAGLATADHVRDLEHLVATHRSTSTLPSRRRRGAERRR